MIFTSVTCAVKISVMSHLTSDLFFKINRSEVQRDNNVQTGSYCHCFYFQDKSIEEIMFEDSKYLVTLLLQLLCCCFWKLVLTTKARIFL